MNTTQVNLKKGQAFLIIIVMISVAITVALATSFNTVTDAQLTESQADSLKAVAAADAAVEVGGTAVETGSPKSFRDLNLTHLEDINLDESNVTVYRTEREQFVSPILKKDAQYTFYLSDYINDAFPGTNPVTQMSVFYGSDNGNCTEIALELTLLSGADAPTRPGEVVLKRYISDAGNLLGNENDEIYRDITNPGPPRLIGGRGQYFNCMAVIPTIPPNPRLLFVRIITPSDVETRLGFVGADNSRLPSQGRTIRARAVSNTGVVKVVETFQSYPQIPTEFFVTRW